MTELSLSVDLREHGGKNASRRLRAEGKVPAVVYGGGAAAVSIEVDRQQIVSLLTRGAGENSVFLLKVPGTKEKRHTMIRELQVDPIEHRILHIDFQRIEMSETVRVKVPVELEGIPEGVKNESGIIDFINRELEVECLPNLIPTHLPLDVTALGLGMHAEAGDAVLPEGVTLIDEPERVVVSIAMPRVIEEAEVEEEEEELLEAEQEEPEVISGAKEEQKEAANDR